MKTQKNPVTLLAVFSIWLGLTLGCSSFKRAMEEKRAEREGPGITISAEDLYKAYESNETDADKLYQGKLVIVTGKVGIIDAKIPVVWMDAPQKSHIQCSFAGDQKDAVSKLEFGQTVTVKGKCVGKVLGFVSLNDCVLQ
jgi:hypothetical protein